MSWAAASVNGPMLHPISETRGNYLTVGITFDFQCNVYLCGVLCQMFKPSVGSSINVRLLVVHEIVPRAKKIFILSHNIFSILCYATYKGCHQDLFLVLRCGPHQKIKQANNCSSFSRCIAIFCTQNSYFVIPFVVGKLLNNYKCSFICPSVRFREKHNFLSY